MHGFDELAESMAGLLDLYVRWAKRKGLSANEFFVVYSVFHHGWCAPKTVGDEWHLPKQTVSFTCKQLAEKGWLAFAPDPDDKRGKLLYLTAAGEAAVRPWMDELEQAERESAVQFGGKKLEKTVLELQRLNGIFSEKLGI